MWLVATITLRRFVAGSGRRPPHQNENTSLSVACLLPPRADIAQRNRNDPLNSRPLPCGRSKDRRPTSDRDSPRRRMDLREPANKRLITDVSGLAPTVARSSHQSFSTELVERSGCVASET